MAAMLYGVEMDEREPSREEIARVDAAVRQDIRTALLNVADGISDITFALDEYASDVRFCIEHDLLPERVGLQLAQCMQELDQAFESLLRHADDVVDPVHNVDRWRI